MEKAEICVRILVPDDVFKAARLVGALTGESAESILTSFAGDGFGALEIKLGDLLPEGGSLTGDQLNQLFNLNGEVKVQFHRRIT